MAVLDAVVIAVIGIVIIEGIWLAALTYLLWRRAKRPKPEDAKPEAPENESS
ncbi:MAG TPA: hypothetical protein VGR51_02040 [Thermoplasmata archaeon]|nr:hypothetical protein [Thermoplasmata archaeon]